MDYHVLSEGISDAFPECSQECHHSLTSSKGEMQKYIVTSMQTETGLFLNVEMVQVQEFQSRPLIS